MGSYLCKFRFETREGTMEVTLDGKGVRRTGTKNLKVGRSMGPKSY